ncbi:MAG: insulinase family protein [Anaeroplasmataceae bacterium]|nr:insulinase family protein [Anaeroplasmataceae bacterium]
MNETYITKCGLKVIYVEKRGFHQSYAGIGVNYGSRDLEYQLSDQKIKSPSGTAHFLEHKLFQMPNGDAFSMFSKENAHANAYTGLEKTIYYFTTAESIYPSLKLLLEMYFTPYFLKEEVEREKGIIYSEIQMQQDIEWSQFNLQMLDALYPKSGLSKSVVGTKESVSKIMAQDLKNAYDAFYTSDNSFLVVVSNQPREKILSYIEEVLEHLQIRRGIPQYKKENFTIGTDFIRKGNVEQNNAALAIRLDANQADSFFCDYMIGILDCFFSPVSAFYKELYQQKAFFADIDYSVMTLRDTSFIILSTTTNKPKLFLKKAKEKLKSITKKD